MIAQEHVLYGYPCQKKNNQNPGRIFTPEIYIVKNLTTAANIMLLKAKITS